MAKTKSKLKISNSCITKTYVIISTFVVVSYIIIDTQLSGNVLIETSKYETNVNIQLYKSRNERFWHKLENLFKTDIPSHLLEETYTEQQVAEMGMGSDIDAEWQFDYPLHVDVIYDDNSSVVVREYDDTAAEEVNNTKTGDKTKPNWRKKPMFQTIYKVPVIKRIKDRYVFYMSAIASNSSGSDTWDQVVLNGWEGGSYRNTNLTCCFKQKDGVISHSLVDHKTRWDVCPIKVIEATRWVCPNPLKEFGIVPEEVGLSLRGGCQNIQFLPIERAESMPNGSIGLCAKVAYGEFPAGRLVEWFEVNKLMGVDKVVMFTYNLTEAAEKVITHYEDSGFLVRKYFDYPMKLTYPRFIGQKYMLAWHDEQVTVYDCMERLSGYSYVAILDLDEFLIPNKNVYENWDTMLSSLTKSYVKGSGFSFHTEIFTLDWGVSNPAGELFVTKYLDRTRPMWDRKKNIMIPNRVVPGSAWTHNFKSIPGKKLVNVTSELANIKHFRRCRPHWKAQGTCLKNRRRYREKTMLHVVGKIGKTIKSIQKELNVPPYI